MTEDPISPRALYATACGCMAVFGVVTLLMGALLPTIGGLSYSQAATLGSLPFIGVLISTSMVGPFLDILGRKPIMAFSVVLVVVTIATMPLLHGFVPLGSAALIYGLAGGLLSPATNALVVDVRAKHRTSAINLLGAFHSLGSVSAPLLLAVLSPKLSVSGVLWLLCIMAVIPLVPILWLPFPPPAYAKANALQMLRVLRQRPVWLFALLMFFVVGQETCIFVWGSKIIQDALHLSPKLTNQAFAGFALSLGLGRLFAIGWLRWIGTRWTLFTSAIVSAVGALVGHSGASLPMMATGFVLMGLGMATISPTTIGLAGDYFPKEAGTVLSSIVAIGLVGGISLSRMAAVLGENGSRPLAILWIPVCTATIILVLSLVLTSQKWQVRTAVLVS